MRKVYYYILLLTIVGTAAYGQTPPGTGLSARDSMDVMKELMNLLDKADQPASYFFANVSVGNRLFSAKNDALNARQTEARMIYSPSVAYFHKTGLSLTASATLLNDRTGFGVNHYSVIPAYDLPFNKAYSFGVSYAHYFVRDKFSSFSSPVQNDLYASFKFRRTWLQPGAALGYATGEYKEARFKDTSIIAVRKHLYDSVTNKLKSFSLVLSAGHQFSWNNLVFRNDDVVLEAAFMANAGSAKTAIHHKTNAAFLYNFLNKRGRIPKFQRTQFELQSVGLNLDFKYTIGNLTLEPQLYTDYYLPDTETKRLTTVFMFNAGYAF